MIEIKSALKSFGQFVALDGISFDIPSGSAYGLLGSNGAGKSTILRLLSGIYKLDSGEILVDEKKVFDNPEVLEKIFFVNDETVQFNTMTLTDMKNYYKCFYPSFSDAKFDELWKVLKLPLNRKLATFSKGMKRQAAVICGIAAGTDYLLLDEAFDGLDPTMRIIVKKMLVDAMIDRNMTVIISSHNLREIDEFCDRVGLLHKGRLVFNRELDSVKGQIHKIQTAFDKPFDKADFPELEILHSSTMGSIVYIIAKGEAEELRKKLTAHNPKILDIIPLSLEEIFIYEMEVLGYDYSGIDNQ